MSLGVYSEVGKLRKVMVHRPGLEHARLTPANAEELLFDDVLWVRQAKAEHDTFCEVMRDRGPRCSTQNGHSPRFWPSQA
jgi:arginine deiminase